MSKCGVLYRWQDEPQVSAVTCESPYLRSLSAIQMFPVDSTIAKDQPVAVRGYRRRDIVGCAMGESFDFTSMSLIPTNRKAPDLGITVETPKDDRSTGV
jgi:hypothetical protein